MNSIGDSIRTYRKAAGLTQDDLAEKLHVTRQTISNYESGKSLPSVDVLEHLAAIFQVPLSDLVHNRETESKHRSSHFVIKIVLCVALLLILIFLIWAAGRYIWYFRINNDLYGLEQAYIYVARPILLFAIGFVFSALLRPLGLHLSLHTQKMRTAVFIILIALLVITVFSIFYDILYIVQQCRIDFQILNARKEQIDFINQSVPIHLLGVTVTHAVNTCVRALWPLYLVFGFAADFLLSALRKEAPKK